MKILTEAEYKAKSKTGLRGVYVLFGDEDYLISHYRNKAREPFLGDELNYSKLMYSTSEDTGAIVTAAMSLPFMSEVGYRLVEVVTDGFDAMKEGDRTAFIEALSAASGSEDAIVLVSFLSGTFDYGTLPKRPSALCKRLIESEGISPVYFPRSRPAQLRKWIEKHFERAGLTFEYDAADRMLSRVGDSMTKLSPEIDKVIAYVKSHEGERVTPADVDAATVTSEEFGAFELSNSIVDGRIADALIIVRSEEKKKTEPALLVSGISRVISDMLAVKSLAVKGMVSGEIAKSLGMHEYRVGLYMKSTARADISSIDGAMRLALDAEYRLKSSRFGYDGVERLICEIGLCMRGKA